MEEKEEAGVDVSLVDTSQTQHILNQGAGLNGIGGLHLLQGREIASRKKQKLGTVEALDGHLFNIGIIVLGLQMPLASHADQQGYQKYRIELLHAT